MLISENMILLFLCVPVFLNILKIIIKFFILFIKVSKIEHLS